MTPVFVLVSTISSFLVIKGLGRAPLCCVGAVLVAIAGITAREHVTTMVDESPATRMTHLHFAATSGFIGAVGFTAFLGVYLVFFQVDYVRVLGFSVTRISRKQER